MESLEGRRPQVGMPPIAKCDPVTFVPAAGEAAGPPDAISRNHRRFDVAAGPPDAISRNHRRFGVAAGSPFSESVIPQRVALL
jgi:hypothetical protein